MAAPESPAPSPPIHNGIRTDRDERSGNAFRAVTTRWVIVAWAAALVALLIQGWLEPFTAGSHMGLFTNGGDLQVYQAGGRQLMHGDALYAAPLPPDGWFTYPPFAAVVFIPLSLLAFPVAQVVWMLASVGALAATIWRCATVLGYRADCRLALLVAALSAVVLDVEAVRGTLWQGQVNLVLMALVIWDLTRPRGARLRGWAVGVAAGIKLTAIVFVPYLLVTRQWRAATIACATAAFTALVCALLLPVDSLQYWSHAVFQTDRIGPLTHPGNFSFGGILAQIWAPAPMPVLGWLLCVAAASTLGYVAAQRAEAANRQLLAVTVVGLLSCALPPLAWGHHWVWTVPLLALILDRAVRAGGRSRWGWAAVTAAIYLVVFMWFNVWLYRTGMHLAGQYPTYVAALDAAIERMTRVDKLLVVAAHPLLFVLVAAWAVRQPKRHEHLAE